MALYRSAPVSVVFVVSALVLGGCPGGGAATKKVPEACREIGQQCEFAPGKLGACMYRSNCDGPNCLYCQSQH